MFRATAGMFGEPDSPTEVELTSSEKKRRRRQAWTSAVTTPTPASEPSPVVPAEPVLLKPLRVDGDSVAVDDLDLSAQHQDPPQTDQPDTTTEAAVDENDERELQPDAPLCGDCGDCEGCWAGLPHHGTAAVPKTCSRSC